MSDALFKVMLLALIAMQGNDNTATLQGTVVRAGTSEGLSKAFVELYPANVGTLSDYDSNAAILSFIKTKEKTFSASTDIKGAFSISGIPEGRYRLSATRNGFSRSEFGQRGGNDQGAIINIVAGARLANLAVAMRPAPTINGVVHDERDRPVPYAAVLAFAVEYQPGGARKYRLIQSVNSDDRGQYRLFWLSPRDYIVAVDHSEGALHEIVNLGTPDVNPNLARPDVDYPIHYYPITVDIAAARPIRLTAGLDAQGIDFKIQRVPMSTIHGTVSPMPPNAQPYDVQMILLPVVVVGRNASYRYRPNKDGTFEIPGVAPGRYVIQTIQRRPTSLRSAPVVVDVQGKDVNGVVVTLMPRIEVRGRLRVDGAIGPLPFATAGMTVRLSDRLGSPLFISMQVDQDGTITAPDDGFAGDFDASVLGLTADYYLKAVMASGKDVLESGIHIESAASDTLEFVIGHHNGVVSGAVTNAQAQPVTGAMVVFVPEEKLRGRVDRYRRVTTDSEGRFRAVSLPPGRYTAYAFDEVSFDDVYNPEFLIRYAGRGNEVVVVENQDRTANLRLIPAEQ
jgi:Carboxypeptidase regulatory-like domain